MSVTAPPRPPSPDRSNEPLDREEIEALVEALIEEARRETRRRRRRYWAVAALVTFVGVVALLEGGAASQTAPPAVSAQPNAATRPGTSSIAFVRGDLGPPCRPMSSCARGLYVMNADGTGLRRLTRNATLAAGADPIWSPDGRKLVFVKRPPRSGATCGPAGRCKDEIYVIHADGTGLRRLTRNTVKDFRPVWSPDGGKIAFVRVRGNQTANIYVMNADGSGQRRLTPTLRRSPWVELAWSPDWTKIAFIASASYRGAGDIFVMNADGSGLRNVTNTVTTSFDFAWSPDGRRIAYLDYEGLHGPSASAPLYVVNADGTGKRRLTGPLMVDLGPPSWSLDGQTIAFTGRGGDIYTVHADGTGLRKLTRGPGWDVEADWSPDGRHIAFASSRDDPAHRTYDLFVMNTDGSGQQNLTHTPDVSELGVSWAPARR
jgi:TolB protein